VGDTAEEPEGGWATQQWSRAEDGAQQIQRDDAQWRRPAADTARQRRLQGQARGGGVAAAEGRTQQFRGEMRENSGLEAHRLAASFD